MDAGLCRVFPSGALEFSTIICGVGYQVCWVSLWRFQNNKLGSSPTTFLHLKLHSSTGISGERTDCSLTVNQVSGKPCFPFKLRPEAASTISGCLSQTGLGYRPQPVPLLSKYSQAHRGQDSPVSFKPFLKYQLESYPFPVFTNLEGLWRKACGNTSYVNCLGLFCWGFGIWRLRCRRELFTLALWDGATETVGWGHTVL